MNIDDYFDGTCRICGDEDKVRNKNLYVSGSEGLDVCHGCEMEIVEFVRSRQYEHTANRKLERKWKIEHGNER